MMQAIASLRESRGGSRSPASDEGKKHHAALRRALLAEMLGTFFIVLLGTGVVAVGSFGKANVGGLYGIATVWGVAVAGAAHSFGKVSGSHFNPAISIALSLKLRDGATPLHVSPSKWLHQYIMSQLLGATLGSLLVGFLFQGSFIKLADPLDGTALPPAMGCYPSEEYGLERAIAAEVVGTALLAFGALSFPSAWHLGPWLAALIIVFAPFSGASFNPARELGPRMVSAMLGFDAGTVLGTALAPYMLAPVAGAVVGVFLASYMKQAQIHHPHHHHNHHVWHGSVHVPYYADARHVVLHRPVALGGGAQQPHPHPEDLEAQHHVMGGGAGAQQSETHHVMAGGVEMDHGDADVHHYHPLVPLAPLPKAEGLS